MLYNYVISLTEAHERREHIKKIFDNKNIPFIFFDAISPSVKMDNLIKEILPNLQNAKLTNGEKACLMSHVALWKHCIDEDFPYIGIFEDDVLLGKESASLLNAHQWIDTIYQQTNSFILRLETFLNPVKLKSISLPCKKNYKINILRSVHYGTAAYIVSKSAAIKLIKYLQTIPTNSFDPIDVLMFDRLLFRKDLPIFQISPAPCVQELQLLQDKSSLNSQLENERSSISKDRATSSPSIRTTKKIKKPLPQRILKELKRFSKRIRNKVRKIRDWNLSLEKIPFDQ